MAKPTSDTDNTTDNTIEALLQQRAQYEQWLARLETAAADKAPTGVREKVRADYEARLRGVIDELRGYSATIAEELAQHRENQGRVDGERRKAEEALAEAEIRYAVGEYTDEEWQRISRESERHLDGLREELRAVDGEIGRLAEVQALIAAPGRQAEPAAAAALPAAAVAPAAVPPEALGEAQAAEPEPAPLAPAPAAPAAAPAPAERVPGAAEPAGEIAGGSRGGSKPSTPSAPSPPQTERAGGKAAPPGDELAFLRSVSDEDPASAAATRRQSNPGAGAPTPPPAAAKTPEPAAASTATGRPSGVAKTLKCGECGTLNRPTEWYCERCGAELAAL